MCKALLATGDHAHTIGPGLSAASVYAIENSMSGATTDGRNELRDADAQDASSSRAGAPPVIALNRVSKSFDGTALAVQNVTLTVPQGQFLAIVGASGSGKTTTLKTINRLIEADSGDVRVAGEPVTSLPAHELRRKIGYVFQGIGLFPHMTVAENVAITPQLTGWTKADVAARVLELLDLVHLPRDYADRMPSELSGGQRQRVGVARALAARPRIMLMDEPFGALDPITRDALGVEYRRLHEQMGLTTLMVTHDVLEAVLLADRIVVMRAGEVVADGTPHELLRDHPDDGVRALMDMPRRQTERVQSLIDEVAARELAARDTPSRKLPSQELPR
jgi:osmoprotectant transport system ATP-binding protein